MGEWENGRMGEWERGRKGEAFQHDLFPSLEGLGVGFSKYFFPQISQIYED
jgi:hypothetical protein